MYKRTVCICVICLIQDVLVFHAELVSGCKHFISRESRRAQLSGNQEQ